jgi:hypothetical protein
MYGETNTLDARSVDTTRGGHSTLLNDEWRKRPDDERFLSLDELSGHVRERAEDCDQRIVSMPSLDVNTNSGTPRIEADDRVFGTTHWSFSQLCGQIGAPARYIRRLNPMLAAENLREGIKDCPDDVQIYGDQDTIRAMTGPSYGRIFDHQVVDAVRQMVANSDVAWKVPGVMDWGSGCYDPAVPVTKDTTTLFASDRDVALFLCDDTTPIDVGKLASGDPDLMFRGFFLKNSEVGDGSLYVATMYLRGVCANRCLWGVEGFKEIRIRHTKNAPGRMINDVQPVLDSYRRDGDPKRVVVAINEAKSQRVIPSDPWQKPDEAREEQLGFLTKRMKFSVDTAKAILKHDAPGTDRQQLTTVWDFSNQISSFAQKSKHHDRRLALEAKAGALLERAAA